jgi:hypothetical protein
MPWSTPFDDPIPGIRTLCEAADHIQKLPKAEQVSTAERIQASVAE